MGGWVGVVLCVSVVLWLGLSGNGGQSRIQKTVQRADFISRHRFKWNDVKKGVVNMVMSEQSASAVDVVKKGDVVMNEFVPYPKEGTPWVELYNLQGFY